jgi:hypothetical protein
MTVWIRRAAHSSSLLLLLLRLTGSRRVGGGAAWRELPCKLGKIGTGGPLFSRSRRGPVLPQGAAGVATAANPGVVAAVVAVVVQAAPEAEAGVQEAEGVVHQRRVQRDVGHAAVVEGWVIIVRGHQKPALGQHNLIHDLGVHCRRRLLSDHHHQHPNNNKDKDKDKNKNNTVTLL